MLQSDEGKGPLELLLEESALRGTRAGERYPGCRFFGYFCSYWPEELVLAAGMEPLRLFPGPGSATPAELPSYTCSLARGTLAGALRGEYQDLAGVGFAHTCDTMQCLAGIWPETAAPGPTLMIVPPVTLRAPGAAAYFRAELQELARGLSKIGGQSAGNAELSQALELCSNIRRLAAELDELRPALPSQVIAALLRAGQVMPRREYAAALAGALTELKQMTEEAHGRQRILIAGAVLEGDSLFRLVEDLGGRVVADDTCSGYRHFAQPAGEARSDPWDELVRRYSEMPLCPCRHRSLEERPAYLAELAGSRLAQGAILVIRKYCDPHAWDAVPVAEELRSRGIRTLVLELDGAEVGGQERTRIQAFLESL